MPTLDVPAPGVPAPGVSEPTLRARRWIIGGGLCLLAASCAAAAWLVVLSLPGHHDFATSRSLPVGGATLLRINADSGAVQVHPGSDPRIHADVTGRYTNLRPVVSLTRNGDVTTLTAVCPSEDQLNCSADVFVAVPADLGIMVDAADGPIAATDLTGPLTLDCTNGPITVTGPSGPLTVDAANGDVLISGAHSPVLTVHTDNGNVRAYFTGTPQSADVTSINGGVIVAVPRSSGYAIDATSQHSAVRVNPTLENPRSKRTIAVGTSNGPVTVNPSGP